MSTNDPETSTSPAPGGLPLRGFAMVLIAIAVLLGLWAVYSLTQSDDVAEQAGETQASQAPADPAEPAAPQPGDDAAGVPPEQDATTGAREDGPGDGQEGDDPAAGDDAAADETADEAHRDRDGDAVDSDTPAAAAPGGGAAPAAAPERLNVLNNSTVSNLAADVSEQLGEQGYELGEVGNFSDEIFPETTVFFTPGNADAESRARELASKLDGVARENVDSLPEETAGANDITLVLIGDVAL